MREPTTPDNYHSRVREKARYALNADLSGDHAKYTYTLGEFVKATAELAACQAELKAAEKSEERCRHASHRYRQALYGMGVTTEELNEIAEGTVSK